MRFITILFAALFIAVASYAENGKIAGKISDKTYGDAVIGATITVQGMSVGTVTDVDGRFSLTLPTGEYTIEIKYIGYQQKNIEGVAVKANQTTDVSVVMEENEKTKMNEVVVTARLERETVNALYIQQRNNVSLSSGISADIIQRSPDKNTGEVLKRVSGASIQNGKYVIIRGLSDRYNMAMLNNALMPSTQPDRKAFSFDIVPSNIIDNIIINKTATPEMPGDFAGGVVKVLTKDVPEKDFLNVNLGLGYNSQTTFKNFTTTPSGSTSYFGFPAQDHGLSESWGSTADEYKRMSHEKQAVAVKELPENAYQPTTTSATPNTAVQVSGGKAIDFKNGDKFGIVAAVATNNTKTTVPDGFQRAKYNKENDIHTRSEEGQYRQASNTAALLNLAYTKGKSKISFKNLYNKLYDQTYIVRSGYSTSSLQQNMFNATLPMERSIMNNQLEGAHAFGKKNIKVDWNLNYANMYAYQNDYRTQEFSKPISLTQTGSPVSERDFYSIVDRNSRRFFSTQLDDNYGGSLNITYPFELFGAKQTVKVGYMGLMKNRTFNARVFQYEIYDPSNAALATQPADKILNHENIGTQGFILNEITSPTDRYDAGGNLHAAYVMLDNALGEKLRLIWGARYESYTQSLLTKNRAGTVLDQETKFDDFLPSINATYDLNEKSKMRFAASRTVNRPEFREIAPFGFFDFENIWSITGNENLVRANITNLDLRYEIYPKAGEIISFGAFYKHFKNPIETKMDDQSNLDFLIFTYKNATSAMAVGLEFEARKSLGFIADAVWLNNLILGTNLTYIHSAVDVTAVTGVNTNRPLQGQSPYIINASLMYNAPKAGWAASVLYNRVGERIVVVGNATIPTTWENGRNIVDLQLSKQVLKKKGEIKLTVGDLLNSPTVFYWNTDSKNSYKKGEIVDGINNKGNDLVFQKYRTGTNIVLGFSYRIGE